MTKKQIYETIVSLTAEITTTKVGPMLFEAAKENGQKVQEVCENFVDQYSDLYDKMFTFSDEFVKLIEESKTGCDAEIFGLEKNEENDVWVFDSNIIKASSLFVLTFLTDIDYAYLFRGEYIEIGEDEYITAFSPYFDALEKESGSSDFVDFLGNASFSAEEFESLLECGFNYSYNVYDLLADVFAGKLKEYIQ